MQHILFLLTQDIESPSGLGRYFPLAKGLVHLGHQVTIAALHANFASLEEKRYFKEGVEIWYVGQMHVLKSGNQKTYFPANKLLALTFQATWALSRAALQTSADIIHIGKPHPMNSIAGLCGKYFKNKKIYLDCDDYEAGSGHFTGRWQKRIVASLEEFMPHRAKMVTTNTHFMRQMLITWGIPENKIFYLPNGIDRQRFSTPATGHVKALQAELGLEGKSVVAYIGSLSLASHPVDLLVEAFQTVHQSLPDSVLLLVGGGESLDRLKAQAQELGLTEAVRFCGRVPPDEISSYYRLAQVSIDPVRADDAARGRSPLKLFESWACGIPFVTGDVGDRRTLLGDPPAGLLAQPGDPHSLAQEIHSLLTNPEQAATMAGRGLERVKSFEWDVLTEGLERIYQ